MSRRGEAGQPHADEAPEHGKTVEPPSQTQIGTITSETVRNDMPAAAPTDSAPPAADPQSSPVIVRKLSPAQQRQRELAAVKHGAYATTTALRLRQRRLRRKVRMLR